MPIKISIVAGIALILTYLSFDVAFCERLNPYLPHNAVAAQPCTPYNLDQIPQCSAVYYVPYPVRVPGSQLLPDLPPICQPVEGPLRILVPVP